MELCFQAQPVLPEEFTGVEEDAFTYDSEMPEGGELKLSDGKRCPVKENPPSPLAAKTEKLAQQTKTVFPKAATPMQMATRSFQKGETKAPTEQRATSETTHPQASSTKTLAKSVTETRTQQQSQPQVRTQRRERPTETTRTRGSDVGREKLSNTLRERQWTKEDPTAWWEAQYLEREQERELERHQEQHEEERVEGAGSVRRPMLERPRTGVFALYYILTKIGIHSDGAANFSYKKEVELVDSETTTAHKKRLEEIKVALEKEKSSRRWSTANKVFSWIGSFVAIIGGAVLIATGVGAVAGAMMIAGGLIQITNQILELTGGWKKIAEILPGDSPEKKRAVVTWMQIGISVLCLILSGAGAVWNGLAASQQAIGIAQSAMSLISAVGGGTTQIGMGIHEYLALDKHAEARRYDRILAELQHKRRNLMERVEEGVDRLEQLFDDLAKALEFEVELFRADQMVNR